MLKPTTYFLNKKNLLGIWFRFVKNFGLDLVNFLFNCEMGREHWHFSAVSYICENTCPKGSCSVTITKARHTRFISFSLIAYHGADLASTCIIRVGYSDLHHYLHSANIVVILKY